MAQAPGTFWLIRYPQDGSPKQTIAKFETEGETQIPDEIVEYDDFLIQEISDKSGLSETVDQSGLSEDERELLEKVYLIHP